MKKAFKISAVVLALIALVALSVVLTVSAAETVTEINATNYQVAMQDGGSFKLVEDIVAEDSKVIRIGGNVTLDLNGYTIKSTTTGGLFYQYISLGDKGFSIVDNSQENDGAIIAPDATLIDNNVIGAVKIYDGTFVVAKLSEKDNVRVQGSGEDHDYEGDYANVDETWGTWISVDPDSFCMDGYHGIGSYKKKEVTDKAGEVLYSGALYRVVPEDFDITYIYTDVDGNAIAGVATANPAQFDVETATFELSKEFTRNGTELKGYSLKNDTWVLYEAGNVGEKYQAISKIYQGTYFYDIVLIAEFVPTVYKIEYNFGDYNTFNITNPATNPTSFTNGTADITLAPATKGEATFEGWYTAPDFSGEAVTVIDCSETYNDVVLYAKFDLKEFTITYELDGGTEVVPDGKNPNPTTVTVDTVVSSLNDASKNGYDFVGWYDAKTEGNKVESIALGTNKDITLYARYTTKEYKITYDLGDVDILNQDKLPTSYTIETPTFSLVDPEVDEGTEFTGWVDADGNPVTEIVVGSTGDITLTATWKYTEYKLFFEFGVGVDRDEVNNSKNTVTDDIKYFNKYQETILQDASRPRYTFEGWYSDSDLTQPIEKIEKGTTHNVTVYAKWAPVDYNIVYDENGYQVIVTPDDPATPDVDESKSEKVAFESGATLPENAPKTYNWDSDFELPVPTRVGYVFKGWEVNGTDTIITELKPHTYDGDLSLVAVWEIGDFDVVVRYIYNKDYQAANPALSDKYPEFVFYTKTVSITYGERFEHVVDFTKWNGFVPEAWTYVIESVPAETTTIDIYFEPVVYSTEYVDGELVVTYFDGSTKTVSLNSLASIKLTDNALIYVTADGTETTVSSVVATTDEIKALEAQIATINSNLAKLTADYAKADDTLKAELKAELTSSIAAAIAEVEAKIASNSADIQANKDAIAALNTLVDELAAKIDGLESKDSTLLIVVIIVGVIAAGAAVVGVIALVKKK